MNKYIQKSLLCLLFLATPYINLTAKAMISSEEIENQISKVAASTKVPSKKVKEISNFLERKIAIVDNEEGNIFDVYESKTTSDRSQYLNSIQALSTTHVIMQNFYFNEDKDKEVAGNLDNSIKMAIGLL